MATVDGILLRKRYCCLVQKGQKTPPKQEIAKRSGATDSLREMITVSAEANKETPSIGDQLAENLIAQSLDLPPKAAKVWLRADNEK